jgi:hypothetical protein
LTTTTIAAAAHSTTTTARSQRLSFVIDGCWRSLSNAAAVDGCGGNGVFATAVNDNDRRRRLHPTTASVNNDHSGQRRPSPPPTLTTMTAIAAVNGAVNDDKCIRGSRKSPYA